MIPSQGFTLLECIVVIGILAVLLAVGIPSFSSLSSSTETKTQLNALLNGLHYARSEAIKRRSIIIICPSDHCNDKGNWTNGWIIKAPQNIILYHHPALPSGHYLDWSGMGTNKHVVQFEPDGSIDSVENASFRYCSDHKSRADWVDAIVIFKGRYEIVHNYKRYQCYQLWK